MIDLTKEKLKYIQLMAKASEAESLAKAVKKEGHYSRENIKVWLLQEALNLRKEADEIEL